MVLCDAGIRIAQQTIFPFVAILRVIGTDEAIIGRDDGQVLVVGIAVQAIVVPYCLVEVNVQDEHPVPSVAAEAPVPIHCLSVVKNIVFIGIGVVDYLVALAALTETGKAQSAGTIDDFCLLPAHELSFVGCIADRHLGLPRVHAIIHYAPKVKSECYTIVIVKVRQSDSMAYLVRHDAYAVCLPAGDDTIACSCRTHLAA